MLLNQQLSGLGDVLDENLDMTPMVDVVFQLMTFLLLTYQASAEPAVNMPEASIGVGIEDTDSILLTVAPPDGPGAPAAVYEGLDLDPDRRLADTEAIRLAVEQGLATGRRRVVVQADGDVPWGEVLRIAAAAGEVPGVTLNVGVEDPK